MTEFVQTSGGLVVPISFAEPDRPTEAPDMREVATTGFGRDITRGYVDPMLPLLPMDSVLRLRGNYNYEIYKEVLRDDQVKMGVDQRRLGVIGAETEVVDGGDRPIDVEAGDFLREQLKRINFDRVSDRQWYSVYYGYGVAEIMYGQRGNEVIWDEIRVRDRTRFIWDGDMRLRLLTMYDSFTGELMPNRKFWVVVNGADHDDEPYGLGLAHWLYWPVFFKRGGIKLWLTFLDKFGAPTAKGTYPPNATPEEKQRLLSALQAVHSESGVIIPEGMAIELLEAARSGSASYTELYDRMDRAIAKVTVGQVGSSEGTPGKLGNNDTQESVLNARIKADGDMLCASFNDGPVKWLIEYNFPGAALPKVWRVFEKGEDLNQVAKRDLVLDRLGYQRSEDSVREVYGDGYERKAEPRVPRSGGPEFAEPDTRTDSSADVDQLENESEQLSKANWERLVGKRVNRLLAFAEDSEDLATFRRKLAEIAGEAPDDETVNHFRNAGFAGQLWGRWRASRGSNR